MVCQHNGRLRSQRFGHQFVVNGERDDVVVDDRFGIQKLQDADDVIVFSGTVKQEIER